jgi:hypothetical protein
MLAIQFASYHYVKLFTDFGKLYGEHGRSGSTVNGHSFSAHGSVNLESKHMCILVRIFINK